MRVRERGAFAEKFASNQLPLISKSKSHCALEVEKHCKSDAQGHKMMGRKRDTCHHHAIDYTHEFIIYTYYGAITLEVAGQKHHCMQLNRFTFGLMLIKIKQSNVKQTKVSNKTQHANAFSILWLTFSSFMYIYIYIFIYLLLLLFFFKRTIYCNFSFKRKVWFQLINCLKLDAKTKWIHFIHSFLFLFHFIFIRLCVIFMFLFSR